MHKIANEVKFLEDVVNQTYEAKQDIKNILTRLHDLDSKLVRIFGLLGDKLEITGNQLDEYEKDFVKEYESQIITNEELERTKKFGEVVKEIIGI